jgi:hypothetical protein
MRRHIFISPLSYDNTFLPHPLIDLSQGFDLDLAFDGQQNFNLLDEMIAPSCAGCDPIWHGTWLLGTLVTAQFQDGVARIPEPTMLVLLLSGFASLGLTRRAIRARFLRSLSPQ